MLIKCLIFVATAKKNSHSIVTISHVSMYLLTADADHKIKSKSIILLFLLSLPRNRFIMPFSIFLVASNAFYGAMNEFSRHFHFSSRLSYFFFIKHNKTGKNFFFVTIFYDFLQLFSRKFQTQIHKNVEVNALNAHQKFFQISSIISHTGKKVKSHPQKSHFMTAAFAIRT